MNLLISSNCFLKQLTRTHVNKFLSSLKKNFWLPKPVYACPYKRFQTCNLKIMDHKHVKTWAHDRPICLLLKVGRYIGPRLWFIAWAWQYIPTSFVLARLGWANPISGIEIQACIGPTSHQLMGLQRWSRPKIEEFMEFV